MSLPNTIPDRFYLSGLDSYGRPIFSKKRQVQDAENTAMIARIPDHPAAESEPVLHDDILAFCRERGWIAVHSRMDRKTTQALGTCDFIIAADQGRVFWIEVKSKSGKLTVAQKGFAMQLDKLGHECFLVRSMEDFREAVK